MNGLVDAADTGVGTGVATVSGRCPTGWQPVNNNKTSSFLNIMPPGT
ncbi:MAG: hypothetical protein ACAI44_36475 [Candidatus Sericytochromatia bacterium]